MKRTILVTLAVVGIGAICGMAVHMKRNSAQSAARPETDETADLATSPDSGAAQPETQAVEKRRPALNRTATAGDHPSHREKVTASPPSQAGATPPNPAGQITFNQAIESIASPRASYAQKQAAWQQLRESGRLDQAITELEQRATSNPEVAAYPAALGQAYLQKCSTLQDVREQGILGMKADQVFDAALSLDPNNWEARFTKAVALSYWPTQMNRGMDVMQHFVTLVEQQEAQSPQPQFAQTYVWLGKEYAKYGHVQEARDVWQRGAALFPEDRELRSKLSGK